MSRKRPEARLKAPKVVRAKRGWRVALGAVSHRLGHRSEWLAAAFLMAKGYQVHSAVALEAQAFPNAPNVPSFPSAVLPLDTVYNQVTEYRFSVAP